APENGTAYPTSGVTSAYFANNVLCIMKNNQYWLAVLPESYQITVQAAENGTVYPVGAYRVCRGESLGITMMPDAGYALEQGFVDDQRIGAAAFYKLVDVAADHVFRAVFAPEDLVDTNAAGLPDPWQMTHFGAIDCDTCGAMANPDGDGLNNLSEYNLGSDPTVDDVDGAGIYYEYDALGRIKGITRVPVP
ncbi:MAG: hypothetical protein MI892_21800, partial [Desulfobacterales bacterium]|nr:hypothetical protein [Desulfobacterales bacterium]